MKSVWSFWSKPFQAHRNGSWASEKHHLLAWILSVETARQHYPRTGLFTDDAGVKLLVDGLGLEFAEISTALNELAGADVEWWALGKIRAYELQREPFVHLDSDVFLWKRLPGHLESADVLAQNPEPFNPGASYYQPEVMEGALRASVEGWLPEEWTWYRCAGRRQRGDCCGIFGGARMDFIQHYAAQARRLIEHPANQRAWCKLAHKPAYNILFEQYLLSACVEHRGNQPHARGTDVEIRYVFNSAEEAHNRKRAAELGFTHLIADAKKNAVLMDRLENRGRRDYPEKYERCLACLECREDHVSRSAQAAAARNACDSLNHTTYDS